MFRAGSEGPHGDPFPFFYVNSQPMMSPEAHFFSLMTCRFVLNINFLVRGCIQHTWWSVCSWGLGRSWLVPYGLATAWNTTQCPKTAASWSSVILGCVQERVGADRGNRYLWIHLRSYMGTHLRHRRRGAEGDTYWGHSWSFTLGKECSVTEQGCLWGDCGHEWPMPEQGHSWGAPVMGKLWMSRGAVRRKGVRRKEGQREAITSRLQPPAPSIASATGVGGPEQAYWK